MTASFKVPKIEIERRIHYTQESLRKISIDALLVVQRVDLLYFAGTAQNGFLYIPAQGDPLLLIKRFAPRAREESAIPHIIEISSSKEVPERIIDFDGRLPETFAFELDVLPVAHFDFYRQLFPARRYVDGSPLIHAARSLKSPWEIDQLDNTAKLSARTFEYMKNHLKAGYTEMEFAGLFEAFARKIGHGGKLRVRDYQSEVYPWHVLSGPNGGKMGLLDSPFSGEGTSAAFPVGAGFRKMSAHEPILIDLGFVYNGYHMDETRMFAIDSMPPKALKACMATLEIHDAILEAAKPGLPINQLFKISVQKAKALGYEETYLGPPGYKVSFVGHGIGLDLVEKPIISARNEDLLQKGMTLCIEPKINFINEFGAGIESAFTITETGSRMISRVPKKVFIV
ncbi:MAG: Xaa-Pro peptidase family protein [Deltaproteobacteria bacterium]|nr:Xaa-Pro peptidase family protein [Deltaproteobacteria bacterium]